MKIDWILIKSVIKLVLVLPSFLRQEGEMGKKRYNYRIYNINIVIVFKDEDIIVGQISEEKIYWEI